MDGYEYSGNNVPLNVEKTIEYVFEILKEYEMAINKGEKVEINPYINKIYIPMENEKVIEVPQEIQYEAIRKWNLEKNKIKNVKSPVSEKSEKKNKNKHKKKKNKNKSNYLWLLILLVIIVIAFLIYRYKK
jgi:predicted nucleic acid-binding Zn ribbon protein